MSFSCTLAIAGSPFSAETVASSTFAAVVAIAVVAKAGSSSSSISAHFFGLVDADNAAKVWACEGTAELSSPATGAEIWASIGG
jgi:hypothetical protein